MNINRSVGTYTNRSIFETGTVKHVTWTGFEDVNMVSVGSVNGFIAGFYESGDESL
jgi:hypothetical protein